MTFAVGAQTWKAYVQGVLPRLLKAAARGLAWGNTRCRACSEVVFAPEPGAGEPALQSGPPLCADCAALLLPRLAGHCAKCGSIFPNADLPPALCADCLREAPPWAGFYFFGSYEHLLKDLFVAFKFHGDLAAGRLLAQLMSARLAPILRVDLANAHALGRPPLLVPVPVHKKRLQERGFNQSLLLARPLGRLLNLPLTPQALSRTRLDPPQSSLDRKARLTGPKGAFAAHPLVARREVLLVDDVMTTGATLREATRILLKAGASGVRLVVLARTPFAPPAV